jgi:hypothetical protein
MTNTIRLGVRKFYDDVNFIGGISRCGYFTKREAQELIDYGYTLSGLACGQLQPETEAEQLFVDGINSEETPTDNFVKLWHKYQRSLYLAKHKANLNGRRIVHETFVPDDFDSDLLDDGDDADFDNDF